MSQHTGGKQYGSTSAGGKGGDETLTSFGSGNAGPREDLFDTASTMPGNTISGSTSSGTQGNSKGTNSSDQGKTDKVISGIDKGKDMAADRLDDAVDSIRARTGQMDDGQISSAATMAADRLESGAQMLRSFDSEEMLTNLESMIRQKPLESLLVAAGIGYVLARAM